MKKERVIILRTEKVQNIRNQFRIILKMWVEDFRTSLRKRGLYFSKRGDLIRARKFQSESSKYDLLEDLSILVCLFCGHRDKDMVFVPKMRQWLCLDCYAEEMYYENLRNELDISELELREFFDRLTSDEGISLSRSGSRCHEYHYSKLILDRMGIAGETQKQFFELCKHYGGYCDCEIFFNVKPRFFED